MRAGVVLLAALAATGCTGRSYEAIGRTEPRHLVFAGTYELGKDGVGRMALWRNGWDGVCTGRTIKHRGGVRHGVIDCGRYGTGPLTVVVTGAGGYADAELHGQRLRLQLSRAPDPEPEW